MSTKHVRTTGDLIRYGAWLRIDCDACGSANTYSGPEIVETFGLAPIKRVHERLKCKRCGMKVPKLAILPPVGTTGTRRNFFGSGEPRN